MKKKRSKTSNTSAGTRVQPDTDEAGMRDKSRDSELVIGLAGAVGTDLTVVTKLLNERLHRAGYEVVDVHIADEVIDLIVPNEKTPISKADKGSRNFQSTSSKMTRGTLARELSKDNAILALGAASVILDHRPKDSKGRPLIAKRHAYIIKSLKHPDEVRELRHLYHQSFYLIGVHSDRIDQTDFLVETKGMTPEEAENLIERDRKEDAKHGQRLVDTFHMSDFFVRLGEKQKELRRNIWRFLSLLFANPHCAPEFEEYAMFLAFAASLRSKALARQVGAVITRENEVLSAGANDLPSFGGGLKWDESNSVQDPRSIDESTTRKHELLEDIVASGVKKKMSETKLRNVLQASGLMEITDYGREVHAEMEAILCCVRNAISTRHAEMYTTTFPCHNCMKHIVAAGIQRVVFVEPYPKSKAISLHGDVIALKGEDQSLQSNKLTIEPYVGVGPRRFFDLYSTRHGSGRPLKRKDEKGRALAWKPENCDLRHQMRPNSYLDLELNAATLFKHSIEEVARRNKSKERIP